MTEDEFEAFYGRWAGPMTGQVYLVTGDLHEAQDAVQEAFVRAWDRRDKLDAARAPESWVRVTATRLAISRWRRGRRAAEAWARWGRQATAAAGGPQPGGVALERALRTLPPRQRLIVALFYVCDLPVGQVAAETGVSVGTVKTQLSRGRAALAPLLGDRPGLLEDRDA
ncbi:SigE family RNA polymerase sigma factor [Amycolatopsis sp. NPDC004625]|uniref:SigE family RNA polymerase sigma factor n=1 Tax=Amycolatopsis sp. NPDC004625 TaxID=3154670 RepID=UPI0033A1C8CE